MGFAKSLCFVFLLAIDIFSNAEVQRKSNIENKLLARKRIKRQAQGVCIRSESYECTIISEEIYTDFCYDFFYRFYYCQKKRQVKKPGTCFRDVRECCNGYIAASDGSCVLPIPNEGDSTATGRVQSTCNGTEHILTSLNGEVTSENFPELYPNNLKCGWKIVAPPGETIEIKVIVLQMQSSRLACNVGGCRYQCTGDYLRIDDGKAKIWELCGSDSNTPRFLSNTGVVNMKFVSDSLHGYTGFHLTYKVYGGTPPTSTETPVSSTTTTTPETTTATTSSSPTETSTVTSTEETATTSTKSTITTTIDSTSTKQTPTATSTEQKSTTTATSAENTSTEYTRAASEEKTTSAVAITTVAVPQTTEDNGTTKTSGQTNQVQSTTSFQRSSEIVATSTTTLPVTTTSNIPITTTPEAIYCFGDQRLLPCRPRCTYTCVNGFVISSDCRESTTCTSTCGCPKERPVALGTKCLTRQECSSSGDSTATGRVQSTCNGTEHILTSLNGEVTSENFPELYPNNLKCGWKIVAPPGGTIEIKVIVLQMQSSRLACNVGGCRNQCTGDYLRIDDGKAKIWELCGSDSNTLRFLSNTGVVNMKFVSDSLHGYTGFQLTYKVYGGTPPTSTETPVSSTTTTNPETTTATTSSSPTETSTVKSEHTISETATSTTTLPVTTTSNIPITTTPEAIYCFGDQRLLPCHPRCTYTCVNGFVISSDCRESTTCTSTCGCPKERPVALGTKCLTRQECSSSVTTICKGGRVPTSCVGCTRYCPGYEESSNTCTASSNNCVSGCHCPTWAPMWHNGVCLPQQLCPAPKRKVVKCGTQHYRPKVRIVGGEWAVAGSWPWAIQIIKGILGTQKYQCGGTLICSKWILTASHCFLSSRGHTLELVAYLYRVNIGKHKKSDEVGRYVVSQIPERIITHPDYDLTTQINDIALIKLSKAVPMAKHIRPACAPQYADAPLLGRSWGPRPGALCYSVGWGATKNYGPTNEFLKQLSLSVKTPSKCDNVYTDFNQKNMLCVGGQRNRDTCQGDSGGPLLCKHGDRWYVDGVTSYGLQCGDGNPGVYTRVSSYTGWIRQATTGHADCLNINYEWTETKH